jgi:hypothetical protein
MTCLKSLVSTPLFPLSFRYKHKQYTSPSLIHRYTFPQAPYPLNTSKMPEEEKFDAEKAIKRNPHPDFKKVEASRPPWSTNTLTFTQTAQTDWKLGDGGNDGGENLKKKHVEIDPYEEGRPATFNYKLLISAIVPRPVGFCGTVSKDGMQPLEERTRECATNRWYE